MTANTDKILKTGMSQLKTSYTVHGTTSSSIPHSETRRHAKAVKTVEVRHPKQLTCS